MSWKQQSTWNCTTIQQNKWWASFELRHLVSVCFTIRKTIVIHCMFAGYIPSTHKNYYTHFSRLHCTHCCAYSLTVRRPFIYIYNFNRSSFRTCLTNDNSISVGGYLYTRAFYTNCCWISWFVLMICENFINTWYFIQKSRRVHWNANTVKHCQNPFWFE